MLLDKVEAVLEKDLLAPDVGRECADLHELDVHMRYSELL